MAIKRKKAWQNKYASLFINVGFVVISVLVVLGMLSTAYMLKITKPYYNQFGFFLLIPNLLFILACFIAEIILILVLARSVAALPRMEKIVDKIIEGDYKQRIILRDKDLMHTFADKLNKLFELLEKRGK